MHVREMLAAHPLARGQANEAIVACIEDCFDCAQVCVSCADASLSEPSLPELTQDIRLCLDCADLCAAVGALTSRQTGSNELVKRTAIEACITACRLCAEECERHAAHMKHMAVCAEVCRRCEASCRAAAQAITATAH